MVGKGKGEEVAVRAGRVFTDAAPLLLGSADIYSTRPERPFRLGPHGLNVCPLMIQKPQNLKKHPCLGRKTED